MEAHQRTASIREGAEKCGNYSNSAAEKCGREKLFAVFKAWYKV